MVDSGLKADKRGDSPISPEHMDWSTHFPAFVDPDPTKVNATGARKLTKDVEVADIGCGFGGLMIALSPILPDTLMVGKCNTQSQAERDWNRK